MIHILPFIFKYLALDIRPLKMIKVNNVACNKILIDVKFIIIIDIYYCMPLCHVEILCKNNLYLSSSLSSN